MIDDPYFKVEIVSSTPSPQRTVYAAMHQDYAEGFVWDDRDRFPDEAKAGQIVVDRLLAGGRGHFGCLEHPQIVFNCGWFPHSVMQQARTHRVGVSFDCQSLRYTGRRVLDVLDGKRGIEEVFYLRPVGNYNDRVGKKYHYSEEKRESDIGFLEACVARYRSKILDGYSEEHARDLLPYAIRQHFVVSFNARSLMHFLDLRTKSDAQLEIQALCMLMFPHFKAWMPEVAAWYSEHRWNKARLAP